MDLYVAPSTNFQASLSNAPTGLVGTIGVRILDGDGDTVTARSTAGIAESPAGSGLYFVTLTSPALLGPYTILWDNGVVGPSTTATDALYVTYDGLPPTPPSSGLLTLADYKLAAGIPGSDVRKDDQITQLIAAASLAVRNYTERDFGVAAVTETRLYDYDGSGFIDVDDASVITDVEFVVPNSTNLVVDADAWYAGPTRRDDAPVFYYIVLPTSAGFAGSPEMGFERNLDVYVAEGRWRAWSRTAAVTGTWGWPTVPEDVKLATIWTIKEWLATFTTSGGEGLTSEAIENYSRSWGSRSTGQTAAAMAIPNRARDLLAQYTKVLI